MLRARDAGVTKSRLIGGNSRSEVLASTESWYLGIGENLPSSVEVVVRSFEGTAELAGNRTIRGLPDRDEAGEAFRCRRLAPSEIGLALFVGLIVSCLKAPC